MMEKINEYPTVCNLCGGKVIYTSNTLVYGNKKKYGSGYMYYCENCHAYVGTHRPYPKKALGILANEQMRVLKMQCHSLFDRRWRTQKQRCEQYSWLAGKMGIPVSCCHFGWFDIPHLIQAYNILAENTKITL